MRKAGPKAPKDRSRSVKINSKQSLNGSRFISRSELTEDIEVMSDDLSLREATPGDAAIIAGIFNESVMTEEQVTAEQIRDRIEKMGSREKYLLLEKDRSVLGWGLLKRYSDRGGYRFCGETRVYLHPEKLGKGFGTRIKSALIDEARRLNYHHLLARVDAGNTAAIEYNLKLGYQVVGVQKEICFRNGNWEDLVILQLVFLDK